MKAKLKATELISKFRDKVNPYIGSGMLSNTHDDDAIMWQSKKCAHIVADEAIKLADIMDGGFSFEKEIEFWKNVKLEIDTLQHYAQPSALSNK